MQGNIWTANLAIAAAPVATFVPALSGVQNIFLLTLLFFFPHGERSKISRNQWIAVILIAIGVMLIEK